VRQQLAVVRLRLLLLVWLVLVVAVGVEERFKRGEVRVRMCVGVCVGGCAVGEVVVGLVGEGALEQAGQRWEQLLPSVPVAMHQR